MLLNVNGWNLFNRSAKYPLQNVSLLHDWKFESTLLYLPKVLAKRTTNCKVELTYFYFMLLFMHIIGYLIMLSVHR